jgi:hypothetical protein
MPPILKISSFLLPRAIIIDELERFFKKRDVAVVCIYCNYKVQSQQTAPALVASLLKQLAECHPAVYTNVMTLYDSCKVQQIRPGLQQLVEALQSAIGMFSEVFAVVDALDECSDETLAGLLKELRSLSKITSLLVTSRKHGTIAREFNATPQLDIRAMDEDIETYIDDRISGQLLDVGRNPKFREEMVKMITEKAKGMSVSRRTWFCSGIRY